jgi:hypothetical protein
VSQQTTDRSFDDLARALAEGSISRRRALKLFAGTAIAALIPSRALAQPKKVTICHKPGTPDEETIEVSQSAVASHQRHGDRRGPCGTTTTTTTAAPTTTSTTSTTETPTTSTSTSTTSTSTTPMCRPNGGSCSAGSQCCSGNCSGTTCACQPNGGSCTDSSQCCRGRCSSGRCFCVSSASFGCTTTNDCCQETPGITCMPNGQCQL